MQFVCYHESLHFLLFSLPPHTALLVQTGTVAPTQPKYYHLTLSPGQNQALTITLTPSSGNAFLFVSKDQEPVSSNYSSFQWSSTLRLQPQRLVIEDATGDGRTEFFILVQGEGQTECSFTLVASTDVVTIPLMDGQAQRHYVSVGM